jgi:preprotein translocase subunit SecY
MSRQSKISSQTRINWLIDFTVFAGAIVATLSSIYFMYLPVGGYQGGRNPMYGVTILFSRETWDVLHTWGGVAMIVAVAVHFTYHWTWVTTMARRVWNILRRSAAHMSKGARTNLLVDAAIALSFLIAALSGVYFLFAPGGALRGGAAAADAGFIFSRTTWDIVHTWSGAALIFAAVVHFAIHWGWITKVTRRFFAIRLPKQELPEVQAASVHNS